jgi:hypothetical protein
MGNHQQGYRRKVTEQQLRDELYNPRTPTGWRRHLMNSEVIWIVADMDIVKYKEVIKMNFYDFIEAYKQALEREHRRRLMLYGK